MPFIFGKLSESGSEVDEVIEPREFNVLLFIYTWIPEVTLKKNFFYVRIRFIWLCFFHLFFSLP